MPNKTGWCPLLALGTLFAATLSHADDTLGPYLGAAVGESRLTAAQASAYLAPVSSNHFGAWKAFVGIHPVSAFGLELAFIDFGSSSPSLTGGPIFGYFSDSLKESAPVLYGVGYLPLPIPSVFLFAKLGVARLRSDIRESYLPSSCPAITDCIIPSTGRQTESTTDLAYGAGVQTQFGSIQVRVEYERISASFGSPDLASIAVSWSF